MNTKKHIEKLACAQQVLQMIQDAKERVWVFRYSSRESPYPGISQWYKNRANTLEERAIPRLEIRYRNLIHELSNIE